MVITGNDPKAVELLKLLGIQVKKHEVIKAVITIEPDEIISIEVTRWLNIGEYKKGISFLTENYALMSMEEGYIPQLGDVDVTDLNDTYKMIRRNGKIIDTGIPVDVL